MGVGARAACVVALRCRIAPLHRAAAAPHALPLRPLFPPATTACLLLQVRWAQQLHRLLRVHRRKLK
jgi:hypothetical protein